MDLPLRLLAVFAHPDDESLAMGATLARYAAEGVETFLVTATRGEAGRYRDGTDHPGPEALGAIREQELRNAAGELGIREVSFLDFMDGRLDRVDATEAAEKIAGHLRRIRPQVVVTFGPEGAYGHPDHIAISQLTASGVLRAAQGADGVNEAHAVSKLYFIAWTGAKWRVYEEAFKRLVSVVDGVERRTTPWEEWAVTTTVDTRDHWEAAWRAIQCHESQISVYGSLADLDEEGHLALWGSQEYYRVLSTVNGGREKETDLFEGVRGA